MKRLSKSKKMSALLGVSLLVLGACAPDSLTRSGAAQPAPIERGTDDGAATNANEAANTNAAANANEASNSNEANVLAAPGVSASTQPAQPAIDSAARTTLASPLPTPTIRPTPRAQSEIEFTGAVEVIASDMWVVGGRTLAVTAATEIKPGLAIGKLAKVHAVPQANGTLWAREIEPAQRTDNSNSNGNDNGNDNSNGDNGNGNINSNDDNGNDNHDNVNSNDDNGNDDHGGNSNDDHGGNSNNNHGGNSNDDRGGNSNDD